MTLDEQIRAAGDQLLSGWQESGAVNMPENDLHPDPATIAFKLKLVSDRVTALEKIVAELRACQKPLKLA